MLEMQFWYIQGKKTAKFKAKKKKVKPVRTVKNAVLDGIFACMSRKGSCEGESRNTQKCLRYRSLLGRPRKRKEQKE